MTDSILIADDDAAIRESVSTFLNLLSYHVYTAANSKQVLDLLESYPVDILITDVHMEDMNGLELTAMIKKKFDIDVIVMTGLSTEYSYEEAATAGAADFLFKPFQFSELTLRLKRVLRERTLRKERDIMVKKLEELAFSDGLTGLYNSRHFFTQIEKEARRSERYNHPLSLLMLDIDFFKAYNDTWGHLEGDNVLTVVGRLLRTAMRDTDSAYRYGGEEFTVILPETDLEQACVLAERIRGQIQEHPFFPKPAEEIFITISIGAAQRKEKESINSFIKRADQALYKAKENGRNRVAPAT